MSAAAFESSAQFERDLRSANKEWKRGKDASTKWSLGARPAPGVRVDWTNNEPINATEGQLAHSRPKKALDSRAWKREHNIVKMRGNWNMPSTRVKGKYAAHEEISETSRSISDLLPLSPGFHGARKESVSDNFLYNFDRVDSSPGNPLSLDIFVKEPTRATERQVEREYEVLDHNGEVLRGRKARRNLRNGGTPPIEPSQGMGDEDDGFELV